MPLSNAERQRRYRQRLKAKATAFDTLSDAEFLDAIREREARIWAAMSDAEWKAEAKKWRKAVDEAELSLEAAKRAASPIRIKVKRRSRPQS